MPMSSEMSSHTAPSLQECLPPKARMWPCARSRRMASTSFSSCGRRQSAVHLRLQPKFFSVARIGSPLREFPPHPGAAGGGQREDDEEDRQLVHHGVTGSADTH